jgi:tetratricopeptide (TPR) repeat protein
MVAFYTTSFEMVLTTALKYYDEKLVTYYARKLSALADDELLAFVKGRKLATEIYIRSSQGDQAQSKDVYLKKLKEVEAFIDKTGLPCIRGRYYLYRAYGLYYNYMCDDLLMTLEYVNRSKALFGLHNHPLLEGEYILTEGRLGECLYGLSRYQEAKMVFDGLFANYGSHEVLANDVYYRNKWVQLSLIIGDYNTAAKVLDRDFKPYIERKHPTATTTAAITFTKYHLFVGEPEKALQYIQLISSLNTKNLYIMYEIELRNLHCAYFAMIGNVDFSLNLTKTNLRYLKRKNLLDGTVHYDGYYHVLANMVKGKQLSAANQAAFAIQNTGFYGVYGRLLALIAQKYGVDVKIAFEPLYD